MTLTVAQMGVMSRLLDEALPLDAAGRRDWLDRLSAEHLDLAAHLRAGLLPEDSHAAPLKSLSRLPWLGVSGADNPPAASGLQSGARVGPYELIRLLGTGGMAEVWLARRADGAFTRDVALKLPLSTDLRADLEPRFVRERDILASLEHPLIARLYDAGIDPTGLPYLAMEYVQGQSLTSWCDAHRLGLQARLQLILQVSEAVQFAHEKQVIHRDLKPSNILVTQSGQVRLLDFGVSKLLGTEENGQMPLTSVYGRALTPDYASPELLCGGAVDARSDVYSLGVLMYETVTGIRPYRLNSAASVGLLEQAIATVDVKKPSTQCEAEASTTRNTTPEKLTRQLHGDLDAIILKALAKNPAKRYQTAAALADDLRRYNERKPIEALPAGLLVHLRKFVLRNRTVVLASTIAAAAILVVIAFLLGGSPRQTLDQPWRDPLASAKIMRLTDFTGTEQGAAISRDGRYAAFLADRDGHLDAWLTEIGSNRYRKLTEGQTLQLSNSSIRTLDFSPDGALVTIWTRAADGSRPDDVNIMAAPIAGGPLKLYLKDAAEFDWSPDGTRLVFHTTGPGDPLFVRGPGEDAPHQIYIAPAGVHCHFPIWSPDGEFIYFVRGVPPANWDVWRIRPSGAELERITSLDTRVSFPVLLDTHTLIYLATDADGSGPWLYAMDMARKLTRRVSVGLERYTSLAANATGTRLVATLASSRSDLWRVSLNVSAAVRATPSPVAPAIQGAFAPRFGPGYMAYVSTAGGRRGIWKLDHGTATELWNDAGTDRIGAPAIAPDGRRIAFTVENQDWKKLYIIDSDGLTPAHTIEVGPSLRGALAWAPDSQSLVGAILTDGEPRLSNIFLDGKPPQLLVAEYSVDPAWSPDGNYLVYSGADVGTTFPLRASGRDGRPYAMASLILTRGARRVAFARNTGSLVILRGEVGHKNFWLLNPQTGAERQLTDLPSKFTIGDFDVSPDGTEIIFDRVQDSSSIALLERTR
jgi:serine/threonine protein kinase/Tol biopolymer transport system component